jgi:predicted AAA+ superfamily ATPase
MAKKKPQPWFSDDELHAEVRGQNPWWESSRVPGGLLKPFHRSAFYEALRFVDNGSSDRAVMILGARRVGKTKILYQLINHLLGKKIDPRRILFLSLDNPLFQFPNLRQLLEQAARCAGISTTDFQFIFIDEIQYKKDWAKWLKTFVQEPIKRRFVVTGSAAAALQSKGPDEGVGRWVDVHVPTMSLSEYLVLRGRDLGPPHESFDLTRSLQRTPLDAAARDTLVQEFDGYLMRGGFPELAGPKIDIDSAQRLLSEDIAEKVLNRDMAALYGVRQLLSLKQIFLAVAFRSSDIIDRKKLSDDFQVSPATVNQYLDYLQRAFLLRISLRYSPAENRVVRSHPKIYVTDSALRNAVLRRGAAILENSDEMGPVAETAVFNQVYAWAKQKLATVYYWRNPDTDREVDVVVRTQEGKLIPIEVKYKAQLRGDDTQGLKEFIARYRDRTVAAYLVTKSPPEPGWTGSADGIERMSAPELIWRLAWATADPRVREYLDTVRIWKTEQAPAASPDTDAQSVQNPPQEPTA